MRKAMWMAMAALSLSAFSAYAINREIPKVKPICETEDGICKAVDVESFCRNKPKNFQCEFKSIADFIGLYCADCSPAPKPPSDRVAKRCSTNAECPANWVCSEPFRGDVSKVGVPGRISPSARPAAKYCIPRPPAVKKCGPTIKCAPGEACVQGGCFAT